MYVLLRTDISWYVYSYNMDKSTNTDLAMAHHGAFLTASAVPATFTSGWIETGFVPLENRGKYWKSLETMGKYWKSLETMGKYGKFIGKSGKIWEIHWKIWENMGHSLENLGKYGKLSEDHGKIMPNSWENHLEIFWCIAVGYWNSACFRGKSSPAASCSRNHNPWVPPWLLGKYL